MKSSISIYSLFNFIIYNYVYIFSLVTLINFFFAITPLVAIFILVISATSSFLSTKYMSLDIFALERESVSFSRTVVIILFLIFLIWSFIIVNRPNTGTDANIYHLPLSLFINNSIWYPGIAKLSSHFGFPNGTSVLASVFTSFGYASFEVIPNLVTWLVYGMGIYFYLLKKNVSVLISLISTCMFILTPYIFFESYNMGTDLPCAFFITFGLAALYNRYYEDSLLFFSLSAIFKTLGLLAYFLVLPYILLIFMRKKTKYSIWKPKIFLSFILLLASLLRVYIATGNPIYPAIPINLAAPWGISQDIQSNIVNGLKNYSGIEKTFFGIVMFMINFVVSPHSVKSGYWFSPFLVISAIISLFLIVKMRDLSFININFLYTCFVMIIMSVLWIAYSPLFRFILGVLIFINLQLFIFLYNRSTRILRSISIAVLCGVLLIFSFNVYEKLTTTILPLINASPKKIEQAMPWYGKEVETVFTTEQTDDGFIYSKSTTNFCQRMPPPCISRRSVANEKELVQAYRKYNKL